MPPTGTCPTCGREGLRLTKSGAVWTHSNPTRDTVSGSYGLNCFGGKPTAVENARRLSALLAAIDEPGWWTASRPNVELLINWIHELQQRLDAVGQWVTTTHHGTAAAEVGAIVGKQPKAVEYCGHCRCPHLDCTC